MIQLRVFGGLNIEVDGSGSTDALLNQPRRCALLVYLALARPRGFQRRDKLLGIFWPEADTHHARSALRSAVYFLRQNLGEEVVVSRGDSELCIDPARLWCDAVAFEDAVANGQSETALALYRGPLLDGFFIAGAPDFEHWLDAERARLRACAEEAAWQLAQRAEASGDGTAAQKWARQAAGFGADDEATIRRLMAFLHRNGDRAGALQSYDAFVLRLREVYELEPSAETRDLAAAIRSVAAGTSSAREKLEATERPSLSVTAATPRPTPRDTTHRLTAARKLIVAIVALVATAFALTLTNRSPALENNTLIVLPFLTAGPDVGPWREGMVDVLANNLDGAGGLRLIDPRTALDGWIDRPEPEVSLVEALSFAASKGARHVLTGSVLQSGEQVRINIRLYDTAARRGRGPIRLFGAWKSLTPLASETVTGSIDSVLVLADRISTDLLRQTILAGSELPLIDVRRTQTTVPRAIKAFLEGERYWRRSRFAEASQAYVRAVKADSAFAFAWYRLYLGCGWVGVICSDTTASHYTRQALLHGDRLPERDRELLMVTLHETTTETKVARMQRFTSRYPDDVEGWYLLGELAYHSISGPTHIPDSIGLMAFARAIEIDPSFGPAYEHPIATAFAKQDTAEATRLIDRLRRNAAIDERIQGYTLAFDLAFGTDAARAAASLTLDTASSAVLQRAHLNYNRMCCATSPALWKLDLQVTRARSASRHEQAERRTAQHIMAMTYMSRGRFRDADSVLAGISLDLLAPAELVMLLNSRVGVPAESSVVRRAEVAAARLRIPPVHRAYALANQLLITNPPSAEAEIRRLRNIGSAASIALADGLRSLMSQDISRAVQSLEVALQAGVPASLSSQLRYDLGRLWLQLDSAQRAEAYLAPLAMREPRVLNAPVEFYRGQAQERLGNPERARMHYARFVDWWRDCDPALRPFLEEGRSALNRLAQLR